VRLEETVKTVTPRGQPADSPAAGHAISAWSSVDYTTHTIRAKDESVVAVLIETKLTSHPRSTNALAQAQRGSTQQ
jgi:hypothetical protein